MDLVHDIASSHNYEAVVASDYILQIQVSGCRSNTMWLSFPSLTPSSLDSLAR